MAIKAGKGGAFKLSTNTVAEIDQWTLNFGPNLVGSAAFGDDWEENTKTLLKWSGTAKGRFDISDTNGWAALQNAALGGTTVSARFYEDGSKYYSGTCYVEIAHSQEVNNLVEASLNLTGSGALSYT